jgi:hypothetical protein
VLLPSLLTWVEESDKITRYGIECSQICSFANITVQAREGKIIGFGDSTMFDGYDMVNGMSQRGIVLMQQTIFAAAVSPFNDQIT